ncbi:MAG: FxsA family protein [Jiangellaceae bacterium]
MSAPFTWRLAVAVYVLAELAMLVLAVRWLGGWVTFVIMVATSLLGGFLIRSQGMRAFSALREAVRAGRAPGREVADTRVVMASGLLLVLPGFLTDIAGLLLLTPPLRSVGRRLLGRRPASASGHGPPDGSGTGQVIRGEVLDPGDD